MKSLKTDYICTGANEDLFTIKFFHGGRWYTPFGNTKYEKGRVAYFDYSHAKDFRREYLEEMALQLGYQFPFGFLFKPKEKHLNLGFRIVEKKEVQSMLEDMTGKNYREAAIYLVLPDPIFVVEWRVDKEAVRHVPDGPNSTSSKKCKIVELPCDTDMATDVVVNP